MNSFIFNIFNRDEFLSEETLINKAKAKCNLSDFGDIPFQEAFHQLIESINKDAQLSAQGLFVLNFHFNRLLCNILKLVEFWRQNPNVVNIKIKSPIVITGLPRTGTTFLHNLISLDAGFRSLRYWELLFPLPNESQRWRIIKAKSFVKGIDLLSPKLATIHKLDALGPEECCFIFDHLFLDSIHNLVFHVPDYNEWYLQHDHLSSYQFYKKMLQTYSFDGKNKPFVLKAPRHLYCLESLLKTYPDAKIIWTHREPGEALASLCSLSETARRLVSEQIDKHKIGQLVLEFVKNEFQAGQRARSQAKAGQIIDVSYQKLVKEPIDTVKRIYEHFNLDYNEDLERVLKSYLQNQRSEKRAVHQYSLEDYGITENIVYDNKPWNIY